MVRSMIDHSSATNRAQPIRRDMVARPSRRDMVAGGIAACAYAVSPLVGWTQIAVAQTVPAKPLAQFETAWAELVQGRPLATGRLTLDIPRLAESGNSVSLKVAVASPMTAADHVQRIHLLSERNPIATIGRFHLTPSSGVAEVETSIRLATTQNVRAIAEMSDGTLQTASAEVVVLLGACLDPG
ncbi:MAG: thiosulfate oxidation carrier protein SoxY [Hyphomicrobium aestuarii]|nr:thiosulfate oxidation carrier protein SoxY [Hyphomicrobium aestuarii]